MYHQIFFAKQHFSFLLVLTIEFALFDFNPKLRFVVCNTKLPLESSKRVHKNSVNDISICSSQVLKQLLRKRVLI